MKNEKGLIAIKILEYWAFRVGYWIICFLFLVYQHPKKIEGIRILAMVDLV